MLLNVNIPDIPYKMLQGRAITRLGKRHKAEGMVATVTPRNETVYWVGAAGQAEDSEEGTDFYAVASHQVSITPLQIDCTRGSGCGGFYRRLHPNWNRRFVVVLFQLLLHHGLALTGGFLPNSQVIRNLSACPQRHEAGLYRAPQYFVQLARLDLAASAGVRRPPGGVARLGRTTVILSVRA